MFNKSIWLIALTSSALVGCGGGGGGSTGSDNETPPPPPSYNVGIFTDSPVEGLAYSTPSYQGLTNERGEFRYNDGERVSFSIGGINLGSAIAADTLTPFSLFEVEAPNQQTAIANALNADFAILTFDKALNIASLLQNLDIDNNPDNGINLGNANAVLSDSQIDINAFKAKEFIESVDISSLREQLGLSSSTRSLQQNIAHLYESLGIEVQADSIAQSAQKSGSSQTKNTFFEYDENGRVSSERTENPSGGEDFLVTYSYDENGRIEEKTNTRQQLRETFTYTTSGQIRSRTAFRDNGADSSESYVYDNQNLVSFSYDEGNDGSVDKLTTYDRSEANKIVTRIFNNGDDTSPPSTTIEETYLPDGLLAIYSEDKDNDGTPDLIVSYNYDEFGNRTVFSVPVDNQGSATSFSEFEYNGDLVTKYIKYEDGAIVYQELYEYDASNNRISTNKDLDGDGIFDHFAQYRYDSSGNRISSAEDFNGDGIADKYWSQSFKTTSLSNPWETIFRQL